MTSRLHATRRYVRGEHPAFTATHRSTFTVAIDRFRWKWIFTRLRA
jgi:hypothetical protein